PCCLSLFSISSHPPPSTRTRHDPGVPWCHRVAPPGPSSHDSSTIASLRHIGQSTPPWPSYLGQSERRGPKMEKAQVELFRAIKSGDLTKARKAYDKGANVNWPLDRWMIGGREHWGLRVQVKPLGIYLGFSARESWRVPDGEGANRGDTLVMVALKCGKREEAAFLLGCDRLNRNCLNEAGNSVADIARATGQEFLLTGRWGGANLPPTVPQQGPGEWDEARPAWEEPGAAAGAVAGGVQYASVVAEAVPADGKGGGGATAGGAVVATAVGDVG
ncbi:unnamed protein product, partial [Ectocarpus sp. 12 AP-2014]